MRYLGWTGMFIVSGSLIIDGLLGIFISSRATVSIIGILYGCNVIFIASLTTTRFVLHRIKDAMKVPDDDEESISRFFAPFKKICDRKNIEK